MITHWKWVYLDTIVKLVDHHFPIFFPKSNGTNLEVSPIPTGAQGVPRRKQFGGRCHVRHLGLADWHQRAMTIEFENMGNL